MAINKNQLLLDALNNLDKLDNDAVKADKQKKALESLVKATSFNEFKLAAGKKDPMQALVSEEFFKPGDLAEAGVDPHANANKFEALQKLAAEKRVILALAPGNFQDWQALTDTGKNAGQLRAVIKDKFADFFTEVQKNADLVVLSDEAVGRIQEKAREVALAKIIKEFDTPQTGITVTVAAKHRSAMEALQTLNSENEVVAEIAATHVSKAAKNIRELTKKREHVAKYGALQEDEDVKAKVIGFDEKLLEITTLLQSEHVFANIAKVIEGKSEAITGIGEYEETEDADADIAHLAPLVDEAEKNLDGLNDAYFLAEQSTKELGDAPTQKKDAQVKLASLQAQLAESYSAQAGKAQDNAQWLAKIQDFESKIKEDRIAKQQIEGIYNEIKTNFEKIKKAYQQVEDLQKKSTALFDGVGDTAEDKKRINESYEEIKGLYDRAKRDFTQVEAQFKQKYPAVPVKEKAVLTSAGGQLFEFQDELVRKGSRPQAPTAQMQNLQDGINLQTDSNTKPSFKGEKLRDGDAIFSTRVFATKAANDGIVADRIAFLKQDNTGKVTDFSKNLNDKEKAQVALKQASMLLNSYEPKDGAITIRGQDHEQAARVMAALLYLQKDIPAFKNVQIKMAVAGADVPSEPGFTNPYTQNKLNIKYINKHLPDTLISKADKEGVAKEVQKLTEARLEVKWENSKFLAAKKLFNTAKIDSIEEKEKLQEGIRFETEEDPKDKANYTFTKK
ncbi:coiled-coil domain-containing protein [Legionella septentrionalis]|uniref:Uncharacterized protein n=1 Tax=Legionella septentrionalis TaxID=2498109 RepID=A0A433JMI7_9GAMM|nr:hypothetical protein [Legionella septentrionalis]RUQ91549.1 hypothetical protein EKM59_00370 [Legionella septentrionalis]